MSITTHRDDLSIDPAGTVTTEDLETAMDVLGVSVTVRPEMRERVARIVAGIDPDMIEYHIPPSMPYIGVRDWTEHYVAGNPPLIAHMGKSYVYCDRLWTRDEGRLSNWTDRDVPEGWKRKPADEQPVCQTCWLTHAVGRCDR